MSGLKKAAGYSTAGIRFAAIGAFAAALPCPAFAVDWTIVYKNDTTLSLNDNVLGTINGQGKKTVGLAVNSVDTVDILARTKTDLFRLTPTVTTDSSFYKDSEFDPQMFPALSGDYTHTGKLYTFGVNANFAFDDAESSDFFRRVQGNVISFDQLVDEEGTRFSYGGGLSYSRRLTKRDTLGWSANYNTTKYQDIETLEPSTTWSSSLSWTRLLSDKYTGTLTGSIAYSDPDPYKTAKDARGRPLPDADGDGKRDLRLVVPPTRVTYETTAAIAAKVTKQLSVNASLGLNIIDEQDAAASASFIYKLNAAYTLKNTTLTAGIGRSSTIGNDGFEDQKYNFDFSATHQLNDLTSFGVNMSYLFSPQPDGLPDNTGLSISPFIQYKPYRDWDTKLSYQYTDTDEDNERTVKNAVVLTVSYNKTLLK